MSNSIKFVGVGGQGTILAAKIMCAVLINAGYDVKMSEIHGMSQRNGSVSSEVRYGEKVYSPVIEKGSADILISFEQMEAARNMDYLKKGGILIVNNHKINSMITLNGKTPYPKNIIESIRGKAKTYIIDAQKYANELGNVKVVNLIMLGALSKILDSRHLDWEKAIKESVKPRFLDINLKAFSIGISQV